ncbi:MAG: hypothetical protein AMS20_02925 [Gemmatimonas sp. SG8_28]|nr:MAG: hypothetical protein AMS20_02925 [Gemmatimonas sp. SG8_28]
MSGETVNALRATHRGTEVSMRRHPSARPLLATLGLLLTGCASHAPPAPPVQPAFEAAVACVVQTMQSAMYTETRRRWVLPNSELRGGNLERDPARPELGRDHLELRFASTTSGETALIRVFGREQGSRVEVNVGVAQTNSRRDRLLRQVAQECTAPGG